MAEGGRRRAEGRRRKAEGGKQTAYTRILLSSYRLSSDCLPPSAFCLCLLLLNTQSAFMRVHWIDSSPEAPSIGVPSASKNAK